MAGCPRRRGARANPSPNPNPNPHPNPKPNPNPNPNQAAQGGGAEEHGPRDQHHLYHLLILQLLAVPPAAPAG
eukprot:scaffold8859_cov36-Phaeocystis_antarctica.AAC.1